MRDFRKFRKRCVPKMQNPRKSRKRCVPKMQISGAKRRGFSQGTLEEILGKSSRKHGEYKENTGKNKNKNEK